METSSSSSVSADVAPAMSLGGRLTNIFASPGEVFDQVKTGPPSHANWLVPLLLGYVMIIVHIMVAFSQPAVIQGVRDQQGKKFEEMVAEGKMTQEQAEGAMQQVERFTTPTVLKISGSIGGIIAGTAWFFVLGLFLWLLSSKIFGASTTYFQILEVSGLASMITLLGVVVSIFLVIATGSMFTNIGPVLLIKEFDPANQMHLALSSINLITLWYLAVLSIGMAKVSNVSLAKAAAWIFGLWILLRALIILSGWGASGM